MAVIPPRRPGGGRFQHTRGQTAKSAAAPRRPDPYQRQRVNQNRLTVRCTKNTSTHTGRRRWCWRCASVAPYPDFWGYVVQSRSARWAQHDPHQRDEQNHSGGFCQPDRAFSAGRSGGVKHRQQTEVQAVLAHHLFRRFILWTGHWRTRRKRSGSP